MHPLFANERFVDANDHGRLETREISCYQINPHRIGLEQAHSLIVVEKTTLEKGKHTQTCHYYASSHRIENKSNAYFHKAIRGHWKGSEIRNHWIKDHLWKEDKTRDQNMEH